MKLVLELSGLVALAALSRGELLPYNPTRIFLSPNNTYAYLFQPSGSTQASLSAVELSRGLDTSSLSPTVISQSLPFLRDDTLLPYAPTIDEDGNVTVITGECSKGASGAQVWRFQPDVKSSTPTGTWSLYETIGQDLQSNTLQAGAQYLANGVVFSRTVTGDYVDSDIYFFGGMCPFANSTDDTWTSSATYSNLMLTFTPRGSSNTFQDFDIGVVPNGGPPIAQAGSSLTPLPATYAIDPTGAPNSQQQNFVLLGGHTETAFINTSQLAVFSLPQQSWNFVDVQQPVNAKTDLAIKGRTTQVTPRSGHSAVLSEDGTSIIVYGGWVGDINTPADPQLAILELGSGYGGSGDWVWSVPHQTGSSPGSAGLYGHGAVLLPGGIMLITGGYEISGSYSSRRRRDASAANLKTYLFNVTSGTWIDSYNTPSSYLKQTSSGESGQSDSSTRVGLGAGLGVGAALLITVTGAYFWYRKRQRQSQGHRERALLYSSDGSSIGQYEQPFYNDVGFDGRGGGGPSAGRHWPTGAYAGELPKPPEMQHTTGMFVNVPSPTRGLRRSHGGKAHQYHQAPRFDETAHSRSIHTITENVEEEEEDDQLADHRKDEQDDLTDVEKKLREVERVLTSHDPMDPFKDPDPTMIPPSLTIGAGNVNNELTSPNWMSSPARKPVPGQEGRNGEWIVYAGPDNQGAGDTAWASSARSDGRTASNLSEKSIISNSSITRTMSTRTGAMLAAAAAATRFGINPGGANSPTDERSHTMSTTTTNGRKSPFAYSSSGSRTRSSTNGSPTRGPAGGTDADSFMTARTNFLQLQSEGEALLGGPPLMDRDDPYQRALAAHSSTHPQIIVTNPTYANVPPQIGGRRRQGWVGSLRRALNAVSNAGERSFSLTGASSRYIDDTSNTAASSPTKERNVQLDNSGKPRRAVSDGGTLLRQKRGQKDWEEKAVFSYHDDPLHDGRAGNSSKNNDWGEPRSSAEDRREAEEDWDVEGAASKRDVQFLFTIPKSRLRVVNDDMDRASLRSASDGAVSRTGSLKHLRREESIKALRALSDVDRGLLLPVTAEEGNGDEEEKEETERGKEKEKEA